MKYRVHIFIDGDNISYSNLKEFNLLPEFCIATFYYDQNHAKMFDNSNLKKYTKNALANINKVVVQEAKNSVDFRIVSDLSRLLQIKEVDYYYIVSGDKGYDSVLGHLKQSYQGEVRAIMRFDSIEKVYKDLLFFEMKTESNLKDALGTLFGGYRKELAMNILTNVFAYGLGK